MTIKLNSHQALEHAIQLAATKTSIKMAVVHPVDFNSLKGAMDAKEANIIQPILVGPQAKIKAVAQKNGIDLNDVELIDTEHSHEAAAISVRLAREGKVGALMKGHLATEELLRAVLHKEMGIRTSRRLSHVFVQQLENYHKPLIITDAAINVTPDLITKKDIVQNAIDFAHSIGIECPKVAILAAVEKVKMTMPSTIEAAALCKMRDRGQLTGAIIDGPLAFDNAISAQAAKDKHIISPVSGDADILVTPNLEAGNMIAKQLDYLANAKSAGIVCGARAPIVLTSRSEGAFGRMASAALAALQAHYMQTQGLYRD